MSLIKVDSLWIPPENIDYVREGNNTSFSPSVIVLKSGIRIDVDSYTELEAIIKQLAAAPADNKMEGR